jgi:hypothetical protein
MVPLPYPPVIALPGGKSEIRAWIQALKAIQTRTAEDDWTFNCGHGGEGHHEVIRNMKVYLQTFVEVTSAAEGRQAAIERMKELFPGFAEDDFMLVHSVNFHVQENPARSHVAT